MAASSTPASLHEVINHDSGVSDSSHGAWVLTALTTIMCVCVCERVSGMTCRASQTCCVQTRCLGGSQVHTFMYVGTSRYVWWTTFGFKAALWGHSGRSSQTLMGFLELGRSFGGYTEAFIVIYCDTNSSMSMRVILRRSPHRGKQQHECVRLLVFYEDPPSQCQRLDRQF